MWHHPYMAPGTWRSGVSRGHREGIKPLPSMPSRERPSAQGMYVAGSHSQSLDIVLVHIKQKQNMPRHIRISTLLRCCYSIFQNPAYLAPIARTRRGCTLYIKFSLYTALRKRVRSSMKHVVALRWLLQDALLQVEQTAAPPCAGVGSSSGSTT